MTIERTRSIDNISIEVFEDEKFEVFIRVVPHTLQGRQKEILFKKGDEKAVYGFLRPLAELCGVEIKHETENQNPVSVDQKQDNPDPSI